MSFDVETDDSDDNGKSLHLAWYQINSLHFVVDVCAMPAPRASSCPPRLWHRQPHELPLRGLPYNTWTRGAPPGVQPVSRQGSPQPKDKGEGKDAKDQPHHAFLQA